MNIVLPIKVTALAENDFYFEYPSKGIELYGTAETLAEALEFARDALEFSLFDLFEEGEKFPEFNQAEYALLEKDSQDNEIISLVATNLKSILEKFGDETVKKTISIPKYQDHYLKRKGISLSKYVQQNIDRELQAF